jgi:hypothetical protein
MSVTNDKCDTLLPVRRQHNIQNLDFWLLHLTPAQRWLLAILVIEVVLAVAWILRWLLPVR